MNKRRVIPLVVLLLLVTPFLGLVEIPTVEAIPDPVSIDTTEDSIVSFMSNQRKLVRDSDGTLYAVYHKKLSGKYQIYIKHSTNYGVNWTGETRISTSSGVEWRPSIGIDSDNNLHVVWTDPEKIMYSKYTTSWSTPILISTLASMVGRTQDWPTISIDSSDNLHVVWDGAVDVFLKERIWYTNYTDTWSTPLQLSTGVDMNDKLQKWAAMAIDHNDYIHIAWAEWKTTVPTQGRIWYTNYTTSWSTPYNISIDADISGGFDTPSLCVDYDDNIHMIWSVEPSAGGYDHDSVWYTKYTTTWSTPIIISNATGMIDYEQLESSMTVDQNNYLHVFWTGKATGYTDYRKTWYANYTTSWTTPICLQPIGQTLYPNTRWSLYPSFNRIAFTIDYIFTNGTGQYDVTFDRILLDPIIQFAITNMDGCGAWVHVGRTQYIFSLNVSHENDGALFSAGVGFYDDAGDWYSIFYDNNTGKATLVSPDDGISASLRSVSTNAGWLNITFSVMFNPTIADTLDVDVYIRIVVPAYGDSGWIVEEADYFNIYNLGGFATLTSSGYAGRTTGGDVFEIYAADKNTPVLVPKQNFDVERSSRGAGWTILGAWVVWPESEDDLIDKLPDWDVFLTERVINHTILLTNRLPSGRPAGTEAFVSYPFGMRIIDDPPNAASEAFSEYSFIRRITAASDELVTVQWMWMTPLTSGTMGMCSVTDNGFYPFWAEGIVGVNTAARVRFGGGGILQAYDGPAWVALQAYTGYTWYNMTMALNVTAQTYDVYVDDVLRGDDLAFPVVCNTLGNIGFYRDVAAGNYTDVFIDDVEGETDWDKPYGGDAKATMLFRNLQHWSVDWGFKIEQGRRYVLLPYANYGLIEFGMDVCLNETWENNFLVARLNITDGIVNLRNNFVEYNITWYQNGTYQRHDILYGLFEGYHTGDAPGAKDTTGWYFDMWFNRVNASTVVGGRLNTKYFGSNDGSDWHEFWFTEWTPMFSDVSESQCFVDLTDSNGVIHSAKEVSLVRPWVRVYRDNRSTFHYAIANTETEFRTTEETMSGIDTPPIKATVVPTMQAAGLAVFIAAAFKQIFGDLADKFPSIATIVIGFVDYIGGIIGYPKFLSNALSWIGNSWGYFVTLMSELFLFQLIGLVFEVISFLLGHGIWWLTAIITTFTNIFTITWAIWDGTYTAIEGLQNMWALMNWNAWVEAVPIFIAIAWFKSLDDRWLANNKQGYFGFLFGDIKILMDITSFIVFLAGSIYEWTVNTITRIMLILKRG